MRQSQQRRILSASLERITTISAGVYNFAALPPAVYDLTATAIGFQVQVRKSVILSVAASLPMNFDLAVAGTTTTIDVKDAATADWQMRKMHCGGGLSLCIMFTFGPLQTRILRTSEEVSAYELKTEVPYIGLPTNTANVVVTSRSPNGGIASCNQLQSSPQGEFGVISMHIMFDLVDNASLTGERPAMSREYGVRMQIRYKEVATGHANATKLPIGGIWIAKMTQYEPAPHHVEFARCEGHFADISDNGLKQASCCDHLGTLIDSYSPGQIPDTVPDAAAGVEQVSLGQALEHYRSQFVFKMARQSFLGKG